MLLTHFHLNSGRYPAACCTIYSAHKSPIAGTSHDHIRRSPFVLLKVTSIMFLQMRLRDESNEILSPSAVLHSRDAHLMTIFSCEAQLQCRNKSLVSESTSVGYQQLIILPISTWQYRLLETFYLMFFLMTVCFWYSSSYRSGIRLHNDRPIFLQSDRPALTLM